MGCDLKVEKASELETDDYDITPQHSTGVLVAHRITEHEEIDGGKWIEITTEDGRKHLVGPDDRVLIMQ